MTVTTRLCAFLAIVVGGVIVWHWHSAPDATHLALRQFQNSDAVYSDLREASLAQNWWPLVWPALLALLGVVMFWEDVERWWKHEEAQ